MFDRNGNRKYLNAEERLRFYEAAKSLPLSSRSAFCLTLFFTGARISEVLHLTPKNLDAADRTVVFQTLKQRHKTRYRSVPIPLEHLDLLLLLAEKNGSGRLWRFSRSTGWKIIKECMKSAGLDGIKATPKGLRHGFAISCVANEIPLPSLRTCMGHARLETTAIYAEMVGEDARDLAKRTWPAGL